jgi:hypothetical protein
LAAESTTVNSIYLYDYVCDFTLRAISDTSGTPHELPPTDDDAQATADAIPAPVDLGELPPAGRRAWTRCEM